MEQLEEEGPARNRRRSSWLASILLIGLGVMIGLVVAADLGWLPFGHAVPEPPVAGIAPPPAPPAAIGSNQNFVQIAKSVKPAVVNIFTTRSGRSGEGPQAMPFDDPFFRRFFGDEFFKRFEAPRERKERSLGSGVIVDPNGLIITNNHVVSKADEIKVFLSDKREFKAKLIGTDSKTDLAVLKVEAEGLHTIPWSDSDKLEVGEFVLAVGNPFGLTQTVTMGIVSAVGRASMGIAEYEDFIQTDAAINPGNSGGALVNVRGELVGINTAIFSQSGGNMGIGFAVPSNMARSILDQLVKAGKVVRGVLDPTQAGHEWAASDWLLDAGVELFVPQAAPGFRKLHHKLMVIDEAIVAAGSFNYTAPANEYNDENLFVMGSPYLDLPGAEGGPVDPDRCGEIASFFRDEIDRIVAVSDPFQP